MPRNLNFILNGSSKYIQILKLRIVTLKINIGMQYVAFHSHILLDFLLLDIIKTCVKL